ncbi:MAG: hypothetical protein RIR18_1245 [Pseudomonadota bacterium]|jgi:UDP-glucose:(heptosyl)LPS alpha-1,3-glucosyltransferase
MALKIALIRQRYNPFGGAERFVERALSALATKGAEITLLTRSWKGAPIEGFKQVICDPPYSRMLGGRAARDQSFCAAAQAVMATEHFDIVQAHERIPGCNIFRAGDGVHAAWLQHRNRVLGLLGRFAQRISPFHSAVLAAEKAMFEHPALKVVICNSRLVADEVAQFYQVPTEKLRVIYNGVDGEVFHPRLAEEFREKVRSAHHIPNEVPLLLFVGSGFERKGIPGLLAAFAQMTRPDARLVVVGADRKLNAMRALAQKLNITKRVIFTGPLKDVRPWYGAADAFVLPTLYDPCPNAALEALSAGLPSLVSNSCGAAEFIQAGGNGYVCDALDVKQMATQLDALCELSKQGKAKVSARAAVSHLTLPAMASELLALYQQL